MPEQKNKEKVLIGQVTETSSADSFIARDLQERKEEYYETSGKTLTASPVGQSNSPGQIGILKPGSYTSGHASTEENRPVQTGGVVIDFSNFKENASGVGRELVADRQNRKAA